MPDSIDSNTSSNNGDFAAGVPMIAQPAGGNTEGKELSDPVDVVIDKLLRYEILCCCSTFFDVRLGLDQLTCLLSILLLCAPLTAQSYDTKIATSFCVNFLLSTTAYEVRVLGSRWISPRQK